MKIWLTDYFLSLLGAIEDGIQAAGFSEQRSVVPNPARWCARDAGNSLSLKIPQCLVIQVRIDKDVSGYFFRRLGQCLEGPCMRVWGSPVHRRVNCVHSVVKGFVYAGLRDVDIASHR